MSFLFLNLSSKISFLGLSYADIAAKIGSTEARVTESESARPRLSDDKCLMTATLVCTSNQKPTTEEFEALARALNISVRLLHLFDIAC